MPDLSGRTTSWDDLPPRPWAEAVEPPTEQLADWLLSLTREQFLWLLGQKRLDWARDSRCFMENHDGLLRQAKGALAEAATTWQRGYDQGFDDAKARALEVLHDHK